ncbi:S-adenosyl-L-methionine-dependent methyltransferase [Macrolepiota fuliginosa MF-IS2]|uniref:S-adenosyl-L-methionine-dependent methyltransferase n=1 Tax=Macrolepiota fuliginosa MF-IS2 TaxID=1400762 RepID=A0A9P5XPG4_9AGAR|nr:S-adenosyl-L-methionine-dependent methyltransferase [Macrolepiota fuliginosa MF-IS2]
MAFVHNIAQKGFGAGTNELYDRIRPSYQPAALEHIRKALRNPGPYNIVEVGAGTGIFTRALLADPEWNKSIKELVAVEPSEGMRDAFAKSVSDDRVHLREGTFQVTGVEDSWADLVVIAQAYHWCPDYDLASAEFARVLKDNGTVVYVWNLEDRGAARWVAQVRDTIEQFESGTPQFRLNLWRQTFDTPSYKRYFESPEEHLWSYSLTATEDIVVDRASSKSYTAVLPSDQKEEVRQKLREIVKKGEDKEWIDEGSGTFYYPYQCWVIVAQKK